MGLNSSGLWIAFKNYYLRDEGQHAATVNAALLCCELLSKIIIFVMKDNLNNNVEATPLVVNCFQKLLSSWWRTTLCCKRTSQQQLWIAFKNYYLRDEGQLLPFISSLVVSCELLSKIIIFVMKDNTKGLKRSRTGVVNCFQKLLSSWWRTTDGTNEFDEVTLWIAFKNYYLRDEGQLICFFC